jgi:hypothetical protein
MIRVARPIAPRARLARAGRAVAAALAGLLWGAVQAQPAAAGQATLDLRITIPPVLQLLEHRHPARLSRDLQGRLQGEQTLVLLTNLRRGACVQLRQHAQAATLGLQWLAQGLELGGATLQADGDQWRVCAAGPGRHLLRLQHAFVPAAAGAAASASATVEDSPAWPLQADVVAL